MTEGRRKKLKRLEIRLQDIIGELVGLSAVEYDAGGAQDKNAETVSYLEMAQMNLKYSLELLERAEKGAKK